MKDLVEQLRDAIINGEEEKKEKVKNVLHIRYEVKTINFSDLGEIDCGSDVGSLKISTLVEVESPK
jgi:alpha-D-ribose 1-methylphosphonate 5-triphosphate diphosphatase PhnM